MPSAHALPRPANLRRSLVHMLNGVIALAFLLLAPDRSWLVIGAGGVAAAAWTMETLRRRSPAVNRALMALFRPIAHAHEGEHVNSATWYATALLVLALLFPPAACAMAVMVLAFADPIAAAVGRRFGTIKLRANRSLEGSVAFAVAGSLAAWATLSLTEVGADLDHRGALALVAGVSGALVELFANRVDDNLAVPVGVAALGSAALLLF